MVQYYTSYFQVLNYSFLISLKNDKELVEEF